MPSVAATAARGTVLVVDDERPIRDFIGAALRKNGYRVLLAPDGREALGICESSREKIDAVVLDTIMPVMGAKEVLPIISGLRPNIRVLLTSGYSESEARRLLRGLSGSRFYTKALHHPPDFESGGETPGVTSGRANRQPS